MYNYLLKIISITFCLIAINLAYAENLELISPWGAVIRSSILPGWGQIHTGKKIRGGVSFVTTSALLASGLIVRASYRDIYDNEYVPAAEVNLYSPETQNAYNKANQRYKLSQFFLFTGLAFWTYSLIDSYVEANLYNAELKADCLLKEIEPIKKTEFKISMTDQQIDLKLETKF